MENLREKKNIDGNQKLENTNQFSFRLKLFFTLFLGIGVFFGFLRIENKTAYADIPFADYATATITNPSSALTDFTLMVDLSQMPASWWTAVDTGDGTKGRAAKDDGTELATDWINFNNVGHTGWLRVKWTGTLAATGGQLLRIYPPLSTNSSYATNATYGSDNAYATHWAAYYALDEAVNNNADGYKDRTKNVRHGTGVSMALPAVAGKVDQATNFDGTADYIQRNNLTVDFTQGTILTWASNAASGVRRYAEVSPVASTNRIVLYSNEVALTGFINGVNVASKASVISPSILQHVAFSWETIADNYELYVGGVAQSADLGVAASTTTVLRNITIGATWDHNVSTMFNGYQDEVQIHSSTLSPAWIAEEYSQTNNNGTFWGTWTWNSSTASIPSAPTIISPTNASFTTDNTPTLSAQYIDASQSGTTNYRVSSTNASDCLSGASLVANGTSAQTLSNNEATTFAPGSSLGSDDPYYWCAQNNNGTDTSAWTTMGIFTLDTTAPSVPGTPNANANTADNTPTWTWTAATDSGSGLNINAYTVRWSQDANFSSSVLSGISNTNSFTHTDALADGTWYFRVSAKDDLDNTSSFSVNGSVVINTAAFPGFTVNYLSTDANGVKSYNITSSYNGNGQHILRVLEPSNPAPGVAHNFIYALPVRADLDNTYGDGLETLRGLNVQNQYNLTIIAPTFGVLPWYADNDTNPDYRYNSFMSLELQPWVKTNLAISEAEQHWLIGFSKSGFGGMGLLMKHPDLFTLGAFWDFPASMANATDYGADVNYGTQTNFDNNYRLSSTFLENHKNYFLSDNRIYISGYSAFQSDITTFGNLLTAKGIQHTMAPEVSRAHSWTSGWVPSAIAELYTDSTIEPAITDVFFGTPTSSTATITWATNLNASSRVDYGTSSGSYDYSTPETDTSNRVISHSVALSSLLPNATYFYRVRSKNSILNEATSAEGSFITAEGDSTPPTTSASPDQGLFNMTQNINLTCDDGAGAGCASIHYSTNGTDYSVYVSAISIPTTTTLYFYSVDNSGNSETPKIKTYTIDTTAPDTTIDTTPTSGTNSTSSDFTFHASETATFQCKLDGGSYVSCATPKNYTTLTEGSHTFSVKATDSATNEDPTPAEYSWTINTFAPDTTIDSHPDANTNSTSATFTFSSIDESAVFQCSLDDADYATCTTPQDYTSLALGVHTFAVKSIDEEDNEDSSSATFSWTIAETPAPADNDDDQEEDYDELDISKVKYSVTDNNQIKITFKTNNYSKGTARFGTDKNLKQKQKESKNKKKHTINLKNLVPGTKYYFRISAEDKHNQSDRSKIYSVTLPKAIVYTSTLNKTTPKPQATIPTSTNQNQESQNPTPQNSNQNHTDKNTDTAPNNSSSDNSPSSQSQLSTVKWWNPFSWF